MAGNKSSWEDLSWIFSGYTGCEVIVMEKRIKVKALGRERRRDTFCCRYYIARQWCSFRAVIFLDCNKKRGFTLIVSQEQRWLSCRTQGVDEPNGKENVRIRTKPFQISSIKVKQIQVPSSASWIFLAVTKRT